MNDVAIAILASTGLSGILIACVQGAFTRRKLGAEATSVITQAAAGVVATLSAEIERQKTAREALVLDHRHEIDAMSVSFVRERDRIRRILRAHTLWDAAAAEKMRELGIVLPPPPPLLPADDFGVEAG